MLHYFKQKCAPILASLSILMSVCKPEVNADTLGNTQQAGNGDDVLSVFPTPECIAAVGKDSPVVIVSTLDGKVSALDAKNGGKLVWSIDIGQGPLVSSSISKLQVNQGGKIVRLIPSLSGGLFKFDGKSVESVPFTAEHLLSSSFKITDDAILVGGKDVTTFGLDSSTGKILYFCSSAGCKTIEEALPGSDVMIVYRRQRTVRSVENRNGHENWNFTVGEVELDISKGKPYHLLEHSGDGDFIREYGSEQRKHEINYEPSSGDEWGDNNVHDGTSSDSYTACKFLDKVRVAVPDGVFCVLDDQDKFRWKHKFDSPIARAWYVYEGKYHKIDLFDPNTVPALKKRNSRDVKAVDPTIYMGFYNSHVYIQVSGNAEQALSKNVIDKPSERRVAQYPYFRSMKFPYRPYLGASDHLTEAVVGEAKEGEIAVYGRSDVEGSCGNTLAIYADVHKHQAGVGYYFKNDLPYYYGSLRDSKRRGRATVEDNGSDSFGGSQIDVVYSSFMHWWKEILIISVTTSIFMQFLIAKITQMNKSIHNKTSETNPNIDSDLGNLQLDVDPAASFESRYLHDFEPIQCLGKGGFGVVFESRNKVDDCSYAVKRIRLPNKEVAREKVMREVRALAKLDHSSIVRYFNAWTEEPPQGWQEKKDREMITDLRNCTTRSKSAMLSASALTGSSTQAKGKGNYSLAENPLERDSDNFSFGNTEPFVPMDVPKDNSTFTARSGTFSAHFQDGDGTRTSAKELQGKFFQSSSSSADEEEYSEIDKDQILPFSRYVNKDESFSVVFQNENCGSSGDSAIVTDAPNRCEKRATKGHMRNVSECTDLPTHDQIFKNRPDGAPEVRRRSNSRKPPTPEDSDTGSELQSVVCRGSSAEEKRQSSDEQKNTTVYLYIQMQLCQKDSLRVWLMNNKTRDDQYCLWIFQKVISAVEYVHDCNLIHRDLKPSNIFFSFDGNVKVGDFGLVTEMEEQAFDENEKQQGISSAHNTAGGSHTERVGTRLYMAPEQMTSRNYSHKVDIFALGLILLELLIPFNTQMERVRELRNARQCKINERFKDCYQLEAKLIKKMLSGQATLRPTASEVAGHQVFAGLQSANQFVQSSDKKRNTSKS